jgi:hypothetical protein
MDLTALLREHRITCILEIGAGAGGFLRTVAPVLRLAGTQATALELSFDPLVEHLLRESGIQTRRVSISNENCYFGSKAPDFIFAVGVLSLGSLAWGNATGVSNRVQWIQQHHHQLMLAAVRHLSDHPSAAVLTSAVTTFLIASRRTLADGCHVLAWEMEERKRTQSWFRNTFRRFRAAYSLTAEECAIYEELWQQAADIAVLVAR